MTRCLSRTTLQFVERLWLAAGAGAALALLALYVAEHGHI